MKVCHVAYDRDMLHGTRGYHVIDMNVSATQNVYMYIYI